MAKRPRQLWRRPYSSFRLGERRAPDGNLDEQRLTLYLPAFVLDWAEELANKAGSPTVQQFCAGLLRGAIEDAHRGEQVAEVEAKRGSLEGYHAITDDPEYLAEWSASNAPRERSEVHIVEGPNPPTEAETMPQGPSPAALVVDRHASPGTDDPSAFLAALRRGEAVPQGGADELLQALNALEIQYRDSVSIDRRVAYALHRLAFEGQILHTDAWPGALDAETVNLLRVVQEAADRVLSGEDIRYYPPAP